MNEAQLNALLEKMQTRKTQYFERKEYTKHRDLAEVFTLHRDSLLNLPVEYGIEHALLGLEPDAGICNFFIFATQHGYAQNFSPDHPYFRAIKKLVNFFSEHSYNECYIKLINDYPWFTDLLIQLEESHPDLLNTATFHLFSMAGVFLGSPLNHASNESMTAALLKLISSEKASLLQDGSLVNTIYCCKHTNAETYVDELLFLNEKYPSLPVDTLCQIISLEEHLKNSFRHFLENWTAREPLLPLLVQLQEEKGHALQNLFLKIISVLLKEEIDLVPNAIDSLLHEERGRGFSRAKFLRADVDEEALPISILRVINDQTDVFFHGRDFASWEYKPEILAIFINYPDLNPVEILKALSQLREEDPDFFYDEKVQAILRSFRRDTRDPITTIDNLYTLCHHCPVLKGKTEFLENLGHHPSSFSNLVDLVKQGKLTSEQIEEMCLEERCVTHKPIEESVASSASSFFGQRQESNLDELKLFLGKDTKNIYRSILLEILNGEDKIFIADELRDALSQDNELNTEIRRHMPYYESTENLLDAINLQRTNQAPQNR